MKKIKVLWFHGLGGSHDPELHKWFKKQGVDFFNPTMDYELNKNNVDLIKYYLGVANKYDYIVGNSMGGFWAFHIGTLLNKKTILFNPAISEKTMSYAWFKKNFLKVKQLSDKEKSETNVTLYLSDKDDVVDFDRTLGWLNENGYKYNFEWLKDENHSLPLDVILTKMFKNFAQ